MSTRTIKRPDAVTIPPLEHGDTLSRDEFERRYDAMPQIKKAELIEGEVFMPSPTRHIQHGKPHLVLVTWLGVYVGSTPGIDGGNNDSVRLDFDNEPQPDGLLFVLPECGGRTSMSADGYIENAPELIGEIAASTASIDMNKKFRVYQRSGVREYVVWRVLDEAIDWFDLDQDHFVPLTTSAAGIYQSRTFPGLWLDPAAMIRGDLQTVLQVLQLGLASPEHAAFVAKLQERKATPR